MNFVHCQTCDVEQPDSPNEALFYFDQKPLCVDCAIDWVARHTLGDPVPALRELQERITLTTLALVLKQRTEAIENE